MATILEFKSAPRPQAASTLSGNRGSAAEIVFFPGVRYDREDDASGDKPKKGKRRRDTMELES